MHSKEVTDILDYVKICYKSEPELLPKYHIFGNYGPERAAEFEVKLAYNKRTKCYIVEENDIFIGYFMISKLNEWNTLNSFYILPQFRDKKIEFFDLIKELLDNKLLVVLKENNPRAIKFIEKLNGKKHCKILDDVFFKIGEF